VRWVALIFAVLPLNAASADAAVTRLALDWSTDSSDRHQNPNVTVFVGGRSVGSYFSRCPTYCSLHEPGLRWEETNFNLGGFARTISLIDDQPGDGRRACFEIGAPPDQETTMRISATLTDPAGASRTVQTTLTAGQTSPVECAPTTFFPASPAVDPSRPSWLEEGIKVLIGRGGRCERGAGTLPAMDPTTGRFNGTFSNDAESCFGAGGNCSATGDHGNPRGDDYEFSCRIGAARPQRATWTCVRGKSATYTQSGPPGVNVDETADWSSGPTTVFPRRSAPTLAGCLARRARIVKVRKGSAVTCSAACRVEVLGVRKALPGDGRERTLRASSTPQTVRVTAGKFRATAKLRKRTTIVDLR